MWLKSNLVIISFLINAIYSIVFSFKQASSEENEHENNNEKKRGIFPVITTIATTIMVIIIMILIIKHVRMWLPAIVIPIASFMLMIYGNSNNFTDFKLVATLMEMDEKKPLHIGILAYLVTFIASMYVFFMLTFNSYIEKWKVETVAEQSVYVALQTTLNIVCVFVVICTFIEIIYFLHNKVHLKKLIEKIAIKTDGMRQYTLYERVILKNNKIDSIGLLILIFVPEIVIKTIISLVSLLTTFVVVAFKLVEASAKPFLKLFEIKLKKNSRMIGTMKSLRLVINWGIIFALSITYFELINKQEVFDQITDYYSFIISIIVLPMLINVIIGHNVKNK